MKFSNRSTIYDEWNTSKQHKGCFRGPWKIDEISCYYKLYGELIFEVPYYFEKWDSYRLEEDPDVMELF